MIAYLRSILSLISHSVGFKNPSAFKFRIQTIKVTIMPKILKLYSYFAFFAFGFFVMILSSAFPRVLTDLSIDYLYGGYLLIIGTAGYVVGSLLCAIFAHITGLKRIAVGGAFFMMLGAFMFALSKNFFEIAAADMIANIGAGFIEVAVGSLVGAFAEQKASSLLNRVNSLFALGALISPFFVSAFIKFGLGWRAVYFFEAFFASIAFVISFRLKEPKITKEEKLNLKLIFSPALLIIDILIMIYVGYEVGYSSWISTLLVRGRGINITVAAISSSVFWMGMFVGRYAASFLKFKEETWLFTIVISSLVSAVISMLASNIYLAVFFIFLSGLSFASTYPTIQAMLTKRAGGRIGNLMGIFVLFVGVGASISQWLIAQVANVEGIFWGFAMIPLFIAFEMMMIVPILKRRKEYGEDAHK